jgi:HD-GYP domain-containing protein (c-di-GMP phosphodiesterase class II)
VPPPVSPSQAPNERPRLAELLAALSLVTDLTRGHPAEEAVRACVVATELGRRTGLSGADLADVYYATLLRFVGCTATSHEMAMHFGGDDNRVRARGDLTDPTVPKELLPFLFSLSEGQPPARRLQAFGSALRHGKRVTREGARADCEVGARMAKRFDLNESVEASLYALFERWDGKGAPQGLKGEAIPMPARYAAVAFAAVMFFGIGGPDGATETLRRWSGRALDPSLVAAFVNQHDDLIEAGTDDAWAAVLAAEPAPQSRVSERRMDDVARGFADVVDLKSPFFHGHSSGVADLAERAGRGAGLPEDDTVALRRAGWLHDLGRTAVATGTWEKPGPLSVAEWEHVRLHAYHTERILSRSKALQPLASLAGFHHERVNGSGYHRGATAQSIDEPKRVLAAADVYQALTEPRPHRPAFEPAAAAKELERTPGLDADAVHAVLEAAGQRPASRPRRSLTSPAGLTEREVEVLRLLVTGRSEKQIATDLFVSPATVHTHVVHIYGKAGVSTRAGAAMFAMENDLIRPGSRPA